jgi:Fe-S cluster assembly iron-binding protein IscA
MLNLTESTVQKLKEVLKQGNITDQGVRIFVSAGG